MEGRRGGVEEGLSAGWTRRVAWQVVVEEAATRWLWTWQRRVGGRLRISDCTCVWSAS